MTRLALRFALLFALLFAGCGGDASADGSTGDDTSGAEDPNAGPDIAVAGDGDHVGAEGDSVSSSPCEEGGHEPVAGEDGTPEDCAVLYDGCCYDAERACEVACGGPDDCAIAESYPGQVSCGG